MPPMPAPAMPWRTCDFHRLCPWIVVSSHLLGCWSSAKFPASRRRRCGWCSTSCPFGDWRTGSRYGTWFRLACSPRALRILSHRRDIAGACRRFPGERRGPPPRWNSRAPCWLVAHACISHRFCTAPNRPAAMPNLLVRSQTSAHFLQAH